MVFSSKKNFFLKKEINFHKTIKSIHSSANSHVYKKELFINQVILKYDIWLQKITAIFWLLLL